MSFDREMAQVIDMLEVVERAERALARAEQGINRFMTADERKLFERWKADGSNEKRDMYMALWAKRVHNKKRRVK